MSEIIYQTQRIVPTNLKEKITIHSPKDIKKIPQVMDIKNKVQENFIVLTLNNKNIIKSIELVGIGSINCIPINVSDVMRCALVRGASSIIMIHNHPSGDNTPSKEDVFFTKRINSIASYLNIKLLDHLIIGDTVLSMAERNLLEKDSYFYELENSKLKNLEKENNQLKRKLSVYEKGEESIKEKIDKAKGRVETEKKNIKKEIML